MLCSIFIFSWFLTNSFFFVSISNNINIAIFYYYYYYYYRPIRVLEDIINATVCIFVTYKLCNLTPSKIACPEMALGASSSYDWQLACWLVQRIASVLLLGWWSVVVIRLIEGVFCRTLSVTDTTTAEITGTKAVRRAVGWMLSILADWLIGRRIILTGSFAPINWQTVVR